MTTLFRCLFPCCFRKRNEEIDVPSPIVHQKSRASSDGYRINFKNHNYIDSVVESNVEDIFKSETSSKEDEKPPTNVFPNRTVISNTESVEILDYRYSNQISNTSSLNHNSFSSTYIPSREPSRSAESFVREEKYNVLYRLLREGESVHNGLSAKNKSSCTDVVYHVAEGSRGTASKYISTCTNLYAARNLLSLKKRSRYRYGCEAIVKIDVRRLPRSVTLIDLTDRYERDKHVLRGVHGYNTINKFHRFASQFSEVLLEGYVPSYCLSIAN